MAKTITTITYLDEILGLLNGETFTINGGELIIRTDTRWHATAPSGMVGHISGNNVISNTLGGKITIDGTKVRWVSFNNGTDTVPAIGTNVFGSGFSAYLLGVYDSLTNAPLTPGSPMPSTGWMKFREVNGAITNGALIRKNISSPPIAIATENDRVGWIEVMGASTTNFSVPRLGEFRVLGDWFELGVTTGTPGQIVQIPTNGGGSQTCVPGLWIEKSPGSGEYEFYPTITSTSNAWLEGNLRNVNNPSIDKRGKFVKCNTNGAVVICEAFTRTGTYTQNVSNVTYSITNNIVTVNSTTHGFSIGEKIYINFTSGPLGGLTERIRIQNATTNNFSFYYFNNGNNGTGNAIHSQRVTITRASHGFQIGSTLNLSFSNNPSSNDVYFVITTPTTDTYTIEGISTTATSGTITENIFIGFLPQAGCKIRVPNVFAWECNTTSGNVTVSPNAVTTNRPDFTSYSGKFTISNFYTSWYLAFFNPFKTEIKNTATFDTMVIDNDFSEFLIDNCGIGIHLNANIYSLSILNCLYGGKVYNSTFFRNTASSGGYTLYCYRTNNITIQNTIFGVIAYSRSSGYTYFAQSSNITLNNIVAINSAYSFAGVSYVEANYLDFCDRLTGYTNASLPFYGFYFTTKSNNIRIRYITLGQNLSHGVQPQSGLIYLMDSNNINISHVYSFNNPYDSKSLSNFAMDYIAYIVSNSFNIRISHVYIRYIRTYHVYCVNTSRSIVSQHIYALYATPVISSSNTYFRSCMSNLHTGLISNVYGSNWMFYMLPNVYYQNYNQGNIRVNMYEPVGESNSYVKIINFGPNAGFTAVNGVAMPNVGDEIEIETPFYVKGYDSFQNVAPTLAGTNTGNFSITYQIDKAGAGYGSWKALTGANLNGEGSLNTEPGFKMKIKIKTTTANASNLLNYISMPMNTSNATQSSMLYPEEENPHTLTIYNVTPGTEIVIYNSTWTSELRRETVSTNTYTYNYIYDSSVGTQQIHILFWHNNKQILVQKNINLPDYDVSLQITQLPDLIYTTLITNTYTINPTSKQIQVSLNENYSVVQAYSTWKNWIRNVNEFNPQYDIAFEINGGVELDNLRTIPKYTKLINDWKILPPSQSYTMRVTDGFLFAEGGGDPFITVPGFTLRIVYDQPVWALAVNTSGGSITPEDVWNYTPRTLTDAAIVRSELSTELGRIDTTISSRLAASDYVAPDNAGIAAIKAKTDNLPPDPADNSDILGAISALPNAVADSVWDESLSSHTTNGSSGKKLDELKNPQAVVGDSVGVVVY